MWNAANGSANISAEISSWSVRPSRSDAHTVGNRRDYSDEGLPRSLRSERFKHVVATTWVPRFHCEALIAKAKEVNADAILVPRPSTQKDIHIKQLTKMEELMEAEGLRDKIILTCGGPRISHELAQELGYDAGFGPGKYAEHVMSTSCRKLKNAAGRTSRRSRTDNIINKTD